MNDILEPTASNTQTALAVTTPVNVDQLNEKDKAKLKAYANAIRDLVTPALSNSALRDKIIFKRQEFAVWVESMIDVELL